MLIDIHTHIFPPDVRDNRDSYAAQDVTFRELYSDPNARIATAEDLLDSMDEARIDVSVALGFAWADTELCKRHSEYLLEAASKSNGCILPFCAIQPSDKEGRDLIRAMASGGARGLGELRPASQGYTLIDSSEADLLGWAADAYDLPLLFHSSEPVGHVYPGKSGLPLEQLGRFVGDFPGATVIAAHWGGGLPFYALMPEMKSAMEQTYFDTAATGYLYSPDIYRIAIDLVGADRIVFGSDFPLVTQKRALDDLRAAPMPDEARPLIEGENARKLLRL
jgi:predicted TIM-barrel fold metal-dependent hydrolase